MVDANTPLQHRSTLDAALDTLRNAIGGGGRNASGLLDRVVATDLRNMSLQRIFERSPMNQAMTTGQMRRLISMTRHNEPMLHS